MVEHRCGPSRNLRNSYVEEKAPKKIKIEMAEVISHNNKLSILEEGGLTSSGIVGEFHAVLVQLVDVWAGPSAEQYLS